VLGTVTAAACAIVAVPAASAGPHGGVSAGPRVAVYLTTADLKTTLARRPDARFRSGTPSGPDLITVNPARAYQRLTAGFGVAMTDTSAWLLARHLPARRRDAVLRLLFSRGRGIGLSFLRVPIGGSDYVVHRPYTYDDMPAGKTDPALTRFSLAHDRPYLIPMIRRALELNRRISIMANPWTPPAWMKTDGKLVTTTGALGHLRSSYYGAYARYLVKFLKGYQAAGIPVRFLGVQNEPLTPLLLVAGIPESYLSPQGEGNLIHDFVAPALRRAGLGQRILAYDDGYYRDQTYIPPVMALAGRDVAGLAYHCYLADPSSASVEHTHYPHQPVFETECSSYLSNIYPEQEAIRSLRNWAQGVQLWNAVLDQHYGPKIGNGCRGITPPWRGQDCIAPVIVNTATHRFRLTHDYWALAQFSKFIHLGARRIASTTPSTCPDTPAGGSDCGLEDVAFRNPDGSQVVVVTAHDGRAHTAIISEGGKSFSYRVPSGGMVTFVWPAVRPARPSHHRRPSCRRGRWLGAWEAPPSDASRGMSIEDEFAPSEVSAPGDKKMPVRDATVRAMLTPTIGGSVVRVHLSNRFATRPVTFTRVTIGAQDSGSGLRGFTVPLRFRGRRSVRVGPGRDVISDPVRFTYSALQTLAVSVFVRGDAALPTEHYTARQTSYFTPAGAGDHSSDRTGGAFTLYNSTRPFVDGLDVRTSGSTGAVVAVGDSITDGYQGRGPAGVPASPQGYDENRRWPDDLARRLIRAHIRLSVLNAGISGNRVLRGGTVGGGPDVYGPSALSRLGKDVVQRVGATTVIWLEGINDIGQSPGASAAQIEAGYRRGIAALHAAGLRVLQGTLTPSGGDVMSSYGGPAANAERLAINRWIRTRSPADGVIDFDRAVRDHADPSRINPRYDGGDHLHMNPAGYQAMADAVHLALLRRASCPAPRPSRASSPPGRPSQGFTG
jgi:glucosylceramidase